MDPAVILLYTYMTVRLAIFHINHLTYSGTELSRPIAHFFSRQILVQFLINLVLYEFFIN